MVAQFFGLFNAGYRSITAHDNALRKVSGETICSIRIQSNSSEAVCDMLMTPELENGIGLTNGISTARLPRNS